MAKKQKGRSPADYTVGYRKPPIDSRFGPGRSANPGGRKKDSVNVNTILERVRNSEITLTEHGQARRVTLAEAVILSAVKNSMSGNQRAIEYLIALFQTLESQNQKQNVELEQDDEDLLNAALARRASSPYPRSDLENPDREVDPDESNDVGTARRRGIRNRGSSS